VHNFGFESVCPDVGNGIDQTLLLVVDDIVVRFVRVR
jgi:hypothetical protein